MGERLCVAPRRHSACMATDPRVERAQQLRRDMTPQERLLWWRLRNKQLGVKFRKQAPLGSYIADFASFEAKIIVDLDGSQHAGREADVARDRVLLVAVSRCCVSGTTRCGRVSTMLWVRSVAPSTAGSGSPPQPFPLGGKYSARRAEGWGNNATTPNACSISKRIANPPPLEEVPGRSEGDGGPTRPPPNACSISKRKAESSALTQLANSGERIRKRRAAEPPSSWSSPSSGTTGGRTPRCSKSRSCRPARSCRSAHRPVPH